MSLNTTSKHSLNTTRLGDSTTSLDTYEALKTSNSDGFNCGELWYCIEQVLYLQPLSHHFSCSPALLGGAIGFTHPVGWEAMKSIRGLQDLNTTVFMTSDKREHQATEMKVCKLWKCQHNSPPLPCAYSQAGWTIASVHFAPGEETRPCTFDLSSVFVLSSLGKPLLTLIIFFAGEG